MSPKKKSSPDRIPEHPSPILAPAPAFRTRSFLLIILLSAVLVFLIFRPFIVTAIMALITAGVFRSLYVFFLKLVRKREGLAAGLSLITVILGLFVPISLIGIMLIREGIRFVSFAQANLDSWLKSVIGLLENLNQRFPFLHLEKINLDSMLPRVLDEALKFIMNIFNTALQGGTEFVFQAVVFLFCLYYFFIDWDRLGDWVGSISPFERVHNRKVYQQFLSMGRAVLKSTLIIGVIQGTIGGIALALVGIQSPIFWGVVMFLLSLLPVVGTGLIWGPAGAILIFSGHPFKGIALILFGLIILGNIDNLLRPRLVGNDTSLHPLAVFLSTLGGLALFGFSGFILGPVIIAMITSLLQIYRDELRPQWLQSTPAQSNPETSD